MTILVRDPDLEGRLKAERAASGADRYDGVWDGVYVMSPLAGDEHQEIVTELAGIFVVVIAWTGLGTVWAGVNVSDREEDWSHNYRIPDLAVFLQGSRARNRDTHWFGGPDFVAEVQSPDDDTRDKLPFYERIGVRELLLIDRDPWALELFQLRDGQLALVGKSSLDASPALASTVLPLHFRLVAGSARPRIEVSHSDGEQRWLVSDRVVDAHEEGPPRIRSGEALAKVLRSSAESV